MSKRNLILSILFPAILLFSAYVFAPSLWRHYEHDPSLENFPKTTQKANGVPGDPLNVGLVGTESELVHAFLKAGWYPADKITFDSSTKIVGSVLFHFPDPTAPVSDLYLWGRKQDRAFEKPVGQDAKQRHHVRLWQSDELGQEGRPFWIGSAAFDRSVGWSRTAHQITHHIGPDVDRERDLLIKDLEQVGQIERMYQVTGVGPTLHGRNGEGDWYYTDGELTIGIISVKNVKQERPPLRLPNPAGVNIKNNFWSVLRFFLERVPS